MLLRIDEVGGVTPLLPYLNTAYDEISPAFSPDGKWMAYGANNSGRYGIYVQAYPGPGGHWLVAEQGSEPTWSRSRHELVYMGPGQRLMVAPYSVTGDSFRPEPPRPWASARSIVRSRGLPTLDGCGFDLHPDGDRAIGAWRAESDQPPSQDSVVIAFNFFDELRRLAPLKR